MLRGWTFYLLLTGCTVGMYMMVIQGPFLMAAKGFTAPSTIGQFIGFSSLVARYAALSTG